MPTVSTAADLASQWSNPSDISTILFILGGDIVQKAFSQGAGKPYAPVCFSFGCAAYAFIALVGILGDGRLLSPPDYPCKILNLGSGYLRDSKSFVLGRLLRDMEAIETRASGAETEDEEDYALNITVFEATWNKNSPTQFSWCHVHIIGAIVTLSQFCIALAPLLINGSWNVLLITALGTALIQWIGVLPQWRAEKLPNRQRSPGVFALTTGNGSRDVMVIIGYGRCLDLESLATMPSPRNSRPWEKFKYLSKPRKLYGDVEATPRRNTLKREAKKCSMWPVKGLPAGFLVTQISVTISSVLWLLLLINLSASASVPETWCLLAIGAIGMFQNAWLAAAELSPAVRNIPMGKVDQIKGRKVMHAIMDFHVTYRLGKPLLNEFFPGKLKDEEMKWWDGDREEYEEKREKWSERFPTDGPSRYRSPQDLPAFMYPLAEEVSD